MRLSPFNTALIFSYFPLSSLRTNDLKDNSNKEKFYFIENVSITFILHFVVGVLQLKLRKQHRGLTISLSVVLICSHLRRCLAVVDGKFSFKAKLRWP